MEAKKPKQEPGQALKPKPVDDVMSPGRIIKNFFVIGLTVLVTVATHMPVREIQSSLDIQVGVGTMSRFIGGVVMLLSQFFLPPFLIRRLGLKRTLLLSIAFGSSSFLGHFYSRLWSLTLSAVISGLAVSVLITAKSTYLTLLANVYPIVYGFSVASIMFGFYYAFFYVGYSIGNVVTYFAFRTPSNRSQNASELIYCGLNFCDWIAVKENTNFQRPSDMQLYVVFGSLAVVSIVPILLVGFFLDDLTSKTTGNGRAMGFLDSAQQLRKWKQLLLLPVAYFRGHFITLLESEFSKSYITCLMGLNDIGLVMLCFGVSCAFFSPLLGFLVRWTGRPAMFALAGAANLFILLTMLLWTPVLDQDFIIFLLVAIWGVGNAVWESQVAPLVGILFPKSSEAAFNTLYVFQELGSTVSFSFSSYVCMRPKVILSSALLAVAVLSYIVLEIKALRKVKVHTPKRITGKVTSV